MESLQTFLQEHFGLLQLGISLFFLVLWLRSRSNEVTKSGFKLREADRNLNFKRNQKGSQDEAQIPKKPLRLSGITADGASHEVLGVSALASEAEIKSAYKEKMKQYHPDRIGPPGSREWQESTRIAEAINRARGDMLEKLKRRSGK